MGDLYGKYLVMLGLVMKLSSISLQLRGNSALHFLDDVKLTFSNYSILAIIDNHIKEVNQIQKGKSRFLWNDFFFGNVNDTWLPRLMYSGRILPPTGYKYVTIE